LDQEESGNPDKKTNIWVAKLSAKKIGVCLITWQVEVLD
jgi:hypothetical protein